jgi:very-short-patch-repair endonuclease
MRAPEPAVARARSLRQRMTLPEVLLWRALRGRDSDVVFRRQFPLGPYVLDFYCPAARLAVEVDGAAHEMGDHPERDARRDRWCKEQGIDTLRIAAAAVLAEPDAVAEHVRSIAAARRLARL